MSQNKAFPLAETVSGEQVTVVALRGGGAFQERIASMGLYVGCLVHVLVSGLGGQMVVAVGDTRIALGEGMAEKVMVRRSHNTSGPGS